MKFIYQFILKIRLVNKENFYYALYSQLFKLTKIKLFKKLSIINHVKFKKLPNSLYFFEQIIKLCEKNKIIFNFKEKKILEVGGGEFWGLMPFFSKQKSKSFTNIDIGINSFVLKSNFIKLRYLNKISEYTSKNDFENFQYDNYKCKIENFSSDEKFDFVVSISCLEHIDAIESFFVNIKKNLSTASKHIHLVNFSNHIHKEEPFKYLYEMSPNDFIKKYDAKINFLRIEDYKKILKKLNYSYSIINVRTSKVDSSRIYKYWEKYKNMDELSVVSAIIVIDGHNQ